MKDLRGVIQTDDKIFAIAGHDIWKGMVADNSLSGKMLSDIYLYAQELTLKIPLYPTTCGWRTSLLISRWRLNSLLKMSLE